MLRPAFPGLRSFIGAEARTTGNLFVAVGEVALRCMFQMAKNVVVVETDYSFCRSFLRSKAGSCVMQANVHIYCTRPNSSLEDETGSRGVQQHFYAAQELIRDVRQELLAP